MKNRRFFGWLILILLVLSCRGGKKPALPAASQTPAPVGGAGLEVKDRLGPGMLFPHLPVADPMGNRYDLYNLLFKPKNVILLLDAFCAACGEESEIFQNLVPPGSDLNLIGVSKDSLPAVLAFKKRHHLIFPILLDVEEKLVPDYRRVAFPTLVVIGPAQKIIELHEGPLSRFQAASLMQTLQN